MKDTLFLRFVAILLITNSHLDSLYPVQGLASGGALGNSLFFFLSGLGLAMSSYEKPMKHFWPWMRKRLFRIYPSLWIVTISGSFLWLGGWKSWRLTEFLQYLFFPTSYWFISALVVFYMLIYAVLKYYQHYTSKILLIGLLAPYFFLYFTIMDLSTFTVESAGLFKWIFYFQVMLFGVYMAPIYKAWKDSHLKPKVIDGVILLLLCSVYVLSKITISNGKFTTFQFLIQWLSLPFTYYVLRLSQHPLIESLMKYPIAGLVASTLGTVTLEVYLLQHYIYQSALVTSLPFPLNTLIFWVIVTPAAWMLHEVAKRIQTKLEKA